MNIHKHLGLKRILGYNWLVYTTEDPQFQFICSQFVGSFLKIKTKDPIIFPDKISVELSLSKFTGAKRVLILDQCPESEQLSFRWKNLRTKNWNSVHYKMAKALRELCGMQHPEERIIYVKITAL